MISEDDNNSGFMWLEFIILVLVVGVVCTIVIPSHLKARHTSQQNACIGNLRTIDAGKEQTSRAFHLTDGDSVSTTSVNQYMYGSMTPRCPSGGTYSYSRIGEDPECTIARPTSHVFAGS